MDELANTEAKMKAVQAKIDEMGKMNDALLGAGKVSEMAKVGMYVSGADQGLSDPKVRLQEEGNRLLKEISNNTKESNGMDF